MKNSKSTSSNTGYKGIYFRAETGKYEAQIITARRQVRNDNKSPHKIHVGNYDTLNAAKKGRKEFILNLL